ncbi:hypothetical protein [Streptomyces sp. NPDC005096]|uniref:hypothetical protein n=1 Tax=Streptomyces sp. NPDC005096 TaxID=3154559 RepID=UPI0033A540C3
MIDTVAEAEAVVARAAKLFADDKARGIATVLQDEGLYRHLQVRNQHGAWFEVATWPGALIFHGAPGTYTFTRADDMLARFQGEAVQVENWADLLSRYSHPALVYAGKDRAARYLQEAMAAAGEQYPDLAEEVEATFFSEYGSADMETVDGFRACAAAFEHDDFRFPVQDWDLKTIDFRFAYACHALAWAVEQWYAHQPAALAV